MKVIRPMEELRPYVRYYWTLKSDKPFSVLTFPIGCPQMIFHRGSPLYIRELSSRQNKFTVSGQVKFPTHIASDGNTEMIVAVFYPHTIGLPDGIVSVSPHTDGWRPRRKISIFVTDRNS